jgi:hypothetical protein
MEDRSFGEIEFEFLDEELEIQKSYRGRWANPLKMFLKSGKKSMIFRTKSKEEQTRGVTAIQTYNREYNLNLTVGRHGATEIYVVRA